MGLEERKGRVRVVDRASTRAAVLTLISLGSGLALFASDYPLHLFPLELVALAPLLWALGTGEPSRLLALRMGIAVGLGYTVPLLTVLGFPPLLGAALGAYVTVLFGVLAVATREVLRLRAPWGPLAAGAVAVLVEWFDFAVVPVWGTAQSFVRVWSAAPSVIQFVSITGVLGLVFLIVAGPALAVAIARRANERAARRRSAVVLICLFAAVAGFDLFSWLRTPVHDVTVAALGWTERPQDIAPLVREAAGRGATLVVTPEVTFKLRADQKAQVLAGLAALARDAKVTLAVGYFDRERNDNRIALFGPDGEARDEYVKSHLIASVENYRPGTGALVVSDLGGARLGGMICQDDNFTDLARGYGRVRAQVVAVPTNDWQAVANYHLENALFRGIENGYALVRAASNGISVVADPRGRVLARHDPFRDGPGMALATVGVYEGGSTYAAGGDLPVVAAAVLMIVAALVLGRRRA